MKSNPGSRRPSLPPLSHPLPPLVTALVLLLLAVAPAASMPRAKRTAGGGAVASTSSEADRAAVKVCHSSTPCGWAVYARFSRNMQYFVQNTCECSRGRACLRAEDDLSASAFVYRCSPQVTTPQ